LPFWIGMLAFICVAAVVDVTLLGRRSADGERCLELVHPIKVDLSR
jgi:hypothetical protein